MTSYGWEILFWAILLSDAESKGPCLGVITIYRCRNRGGGALAPPLSREEGGRRSPPPLLSSRISQDPAKIPLLSPILLSPTQFHSTDSEPICEVFWEVHRRRDRGGGQGTQPRPVILQNVISLDTEKLARRGFQHEGPPPSTHTGETRGGAESPAPPLGPDAYELLKTPHRLVRSQYCKILWEKEEGSWGDLAICASSKVAGGGGGDLLPPPPLKVGGGASAPSLPVPTPIYSDYTQTGCVDSKNMFNSLGSTQPLLPIYGPENYSRSHQTFLSEIEYPFSPGSREREREHADGKTALPKDTTPQDSPAGDTLHLQSLACKWGTLLARTRSKQIRKDPLYILWHFHL